MTCIVDCCHSGTIFDLPFVFKGDGRTGEKMESVSNYKFPHISVVRQLRRKKLFQEYAGFFLVATIALAIPYFYFPKRS